jgi:hypothetical protein
MKSAMLVSSSGLRNDDDDSLARGKMANRIRCACSTGDTLGANSSHRKGHDRASRCSPHCSRTARGQGGRDNRRVLGT